jgi:LysM repeat protein
MGYCDEKYASCLDEGVNMLTHQNIRKYVRKQKRQLGAKAIVLVLGLSVLTALFGVNAAPTHAACSNTYTVRSGDTLSEIAASYGVSWSALAANNGIANPDYLSAGQQLCIGAGAAPAVYQAPLQPGGSITSMIYQIFGPYAPAALRVAMCESSMNPGATNSSRIGYSHAAGLFQILYPSTWARTSQAGNSPYNAWANINAAHEIFVRDGYSWREWACRP